MGKMKGYTVEPIPYSEVVPWLKTKHYARRIPQVQYCYGLLKDNTIIGVSTFGLPSSPHLCRGICGKEYSDIVLEFNRMCLGDNGKNEASFLIGKSLCALPKPAILVSYADTGMGHNGYIYQATNWIYTGLNNEPSRKNPRRYRKYVNGNKHDRHISADDDESILYYAPLKHRYVYFLGSKSQKKKMLAALCYPILPYPKGESKRYDASSEFHTQMRLF